MILLLLLAQFGLNSNLHPPPYIFTFDVVNTQTIAGQFSIMTGKTISVDWGDGRARSTYSGIDQAYSKNYGSAGNRTVKIYLSQCLTKFTMTTTGANIQFDLANLPSGLTYFYCDGSNTVSGDLANLPSGLTYFRCYGYNTVSDYSGKTWTTKPAIFYFIPTGAGGLSEAEINALLIDFDEDLVWVAGNAITLTGTNAAPTGLGATAAQNIRDEGATVTTN